MSKLTFRARNLDASKPMPIYRGDLEDLQKLDLSDMGMISRSVPALPSGMEKEEEAEKHLQDILDAKDNMNVAKSENLVIPTPEVFVETMAVVEPPVKPGEQKIIFKVPKGYIHVQPFNVDRDLPDYDMDLEDERFLREDLNDKRKFEVDGRTFEDMLDRLEKNSGYNVASLKEAKLLLKEDDDLIVAVYDYWVDKRLRLKQPLLPMVKSANRDGTNSNNPYIAFRRRTEKMQTRKNRKNDETSYEKMLKLRRDLSKVVTLLQMVRKREKTKKENLNLTAEIFEKRYLFNDWDGKVISELLTQKPARVLQPYTTFQNRYESWLNLGLGMVGRAGGGLVSADAVGGGGGDKLGKRQYKKRSRQKSSSSSSSLRLSAVAAAAAAAAAAAGVVRSNGPEFGTPSLGDLLSSDDESGVGGRESSSSAARAEAAAAALAAAAEEEIEAPFAFRRKKHCQYLAPLDDLHQGGWPWEDPGIGGWGDARYRYSLASLSTPKPECVGFIRRRIGRGGRVILDRAHTDYDSLWRSMDFTIKDSVRDRQALAPIMTKSADEPSDLADDGEGDDGDGAWPPHFRPVTPPHCKEVEWDPYRTRPSDFAVSVGLPTQPVRPPTHLSGGGSGGGGGPKNRCLAGGSGGGGVPLRTVSVDALVAQNAVSAVVTNDVLDIFGNVSATPQQQPQTPAAPMRT